MPLRPPRQSTKGFQGSTPIPAHAKDHPFISDPPASLQVLLLPPPTGATSTSADTTRSCWSNAACDDTYRDLMWSYHLSVFSGPLRLGGGPLLGIHERRSFFYCIRSRNLLRVKLPCLISIHRTQRGLWNPLCDGLTVVEIFRVHVWITRRSRMELRSDSCNR